MLSHRFYRRDTVRYADPLYAGRHPFQTYLLAVSVVSMIPQMAGGHTASSIEALLPHWVATVWIYWLGVGALTALIGSRLPRRNYATSLVVEQVGLFLVAIPSFLYALAILLYGGWGGLPAASIVLAYSASSLVRGHDIGRVLHRARMIVEDTPMPDAETEQEAAAAAAVAKLRGW